MERVVIFLVGTALIVATCPTQRGAIAIAAALPGDDSSSRVVPSAMEFAPSAVTVIAGKLKTGDASSVAAEDGAVIKIKSVPIDGSFGDIVEYDFTTDLNPRTGSIVLKVLQRTTVAPQQEQLSLFNFSTGTFDLLAVAELSIPVSTITTLSVTNPIPYISESGDVRLQVRIGDTGTERWKHVIDQVKLTAL